MSAKTKHKAKGKPVHSSLTLSFTETAAGEEWLSGLNEPEFRDTVLKQLFVKMQKAEVIEAFENIHGRNDKGIDYLIVERTDLQRRVVGVQVKSKRITRTGDSSSLSSISVKQECEAAMSHEFSLQGDRIRLDNLAIWTSAHITEDAEKEFQTPGGLLKIPVQKAAGVFALIRKYCPELIVKIPQCALSQYLTAKATPGPKALRLLGVPLDPKTHFLRPHLSASAPSSTSRFTTRNRVISPKRENIAIDSFVTSPAHIVINGAELTGKSYLLEHLQCLAAEHSVLPFLLTPTHFTEAFRSIFHLLSKVLSVLTPKEFEEITTNNRIILFVDDVDKIPQTIQDALFALEPTKLTVVATARSIKPREEIGIVHIAGVDYDSLPGFLRALDVDTETRPFTDRAHSFIARSLASSGLPSNPFTVSMLLAECQLSSTKFTTPTMGRLIERFIEHQLGSHSDYYKLVDFETKREFLTRLAGSPNVSITLENLRRLIIRHIHSRSLPHDPEVFLEDVLKSGVFEMSSGGSVVTWSHPVIKQFFWVKNLVGKDQLKPISKLLTAATSETLAAITGSQLKNAGNLINELAATLAKLKPPTEKELMDVAREISTDVLPTEEGENEMLSRIERGDNQLEAEEEGDEEAKQQSGKGTKNTKWPPLSAEERARIEKNIEPIMARVAENRFHVAANLAALVVNARDTRTRDKELCVREILKSNSRLGTIMADFFNAVLETKNEGVQGRKGVVGAWVRVYAMLGITDNMLGDPFLLTVFKSLLQKQKQSTDERLLLLDLLLGCGGEEEHKLILDTLKEMNRPEFSLAMYFRVVGIYFFRYHRENDKKNLRKLLAEIRKWHKFVTLPLIPEPKR